jgi:hypothetical protein
MMKPIDTLFIVSLTLSLLLSSCAPAGHSNFVARARYFPGEANHPFLVVGVVYDRETGKPINAEIAVGQDGAATDQNGSFSFTIHHATTNELRVSALGYKPATIKIATEGVSVIRIELGLERANEIVL